MSSFEKIDNLKYKVFDPTKNITILVESYVDVKDQPNVAKKFMEKVPAAEQVGFVSFDENKNVKLRMAGGEFCGNATMCAAVYAGVRDKINYKTDLTYTKNVYLDALNKYVEVEIECIAENNFIGTVNMPRAKEIKNVKFEDTDEYDNTYDVVYLEGIAHIVIDIEDLKANLSNINNSNYKTNLSASEIDNYSFKTNLSDTNDFNLKKYYESKIKNWCKYLNLNSLGIIFYDKKDNSITPLVYVKNADTLYWENSCASGSIATYEYLKRKNKLFTSDNNQCNKNAELNLLQPCNEYLKVFEFDNKLYLRGGVKVIT